MTDMTCYYYLSVRHPTTTRKPFNFQLCWSKVTVNMISRENQVYPSISFQVGHEAASYFWGLYVRASKYLFWEHKKIVENRKLS